MEQVLKDLPGVTIFLDDVLITGENDTQHWSRVEAVFDRLQESGLRIKESKCELFKENVQYLGYLIDKEGLHTLEQKVKAVKEAPEPENITQLQSFVGLVNYYGRFVPNLSELLSPMYKLLQKDVKWRFDKKCKWAFNMVKKLLSSAKVLAHFDPDHKIKLACDASEYGLGAVISHVYENGLERPIAYASRTLNKSEKRYSQIDKEGLTLIFGIKRFNQYLYGKHFTMVTDHKPLVAIFGSKKGIPSMLANRLQRYAIFLLAYNYDIEFKKSEENSNADFLSRLPLKCNIGSEDEAGLMEECSYIQYVRESHFPIRAQQIRQAIREDKILNKVKGYVLHGWPSKLEESEKELKPFFKKREQITLDQECLMWGYKMIIPKRWHQEILQELHSSHLGMVKMKSIARSYVWWPGVDGDIEQMAKSCSACLMEQPDPERARLHVWNLPEGPWRRIHLDFAGPFRNKMFFLITDAFSKWVEVFEVRSTAAEQTINILRASFARFGLPSHIVSDNGPPFTSQDFRLFLEGNGIKHTLNPPYHPASNGLVENSVRTFKNKVRCLTRENKDISLAINKYLLDYRNAAHSTTGESPAKLMLGRPLRTRLDLIRPDLRNRVEAKQDKQVQNAKGRSNRVLSKGEPVLVKDYTEKNPDKWIPGTITTKLSPVTYTVQIGPDKTCKRHVDQVANLPPTETTSLQDSQGAEIEDQNRAQDSNIELEGKENHSLIRRYPIRERRKPVILDL